MNKYSRQREALLEELCSRKDHPTAEMLYQALRSRNPNYSLGTVYRNLRTFVASGQAVKISMPDGPERYDGCVTPHGHFTCTHCGKVWDVPDGRKEEPQTDEDFAMLQAAGHRITARQVTYYGICADCINLKQVQ